MDERSFFPHINRPGRYLGGEFNRPDLDEGAAVRWALVFPDLYEIGMSHQGLQILYHILNGMQGVSAERCYCPAPDAEALLREKQIALGTLESGRPLASFDLLGITLPHELCYPSILTVLDLAGIDLYAAARDQSQPILIGGGTCAFNPEPVADLFDAILIGDGEEAVVEISTLVGALKNQGCRRRDIIEALARLDGVYLPRRYRPRYDAAGRITAVEAVDGAPARVRRRVLPSLARIDHLYRPLVPNARIVHDRLSVEVARGCTRGCRFCQAGITYRPVRERSSAEVLELATQGIAHSGFEEISLLSLSTGDYSCLPEVLPELMRRFAADKVSVALPSLRVGTLSREMMEQIRQVRKTGFTLAPEAGSERLRQAINKGIGEADLIETAAQAYALGWNLIKLYFMIGLPTETDQDLDAIVDLVEKTARAGAVDGRGRKKIAVSVGTFVPKPHTPFQWEPQLSIEQSRARLSHLRARLQKKSTTLKYHDPEQSFLEGVFSRGDRRLTPLLVRAWERGARLDGWSEYFDLGRWLTAAEDLHIDLEFYLRERGPDEILPWSHLDPGVEDGFLRAERARSRSLDYTPDCRYHACQRCGLCDFKTVLPIVHNRQRMGAQALPAAPPEPSAELASPLPGAEQGESHRYLVSYSRAGRICYLGHLEFLQIIQRGLRRAGLRPCYSEGFNPSPKISFGPALPVGTSSRCEFFAVALRQPIDDLEGTAAALSAALPDGLEVTGISPHTGRLTQDMIASYEIGLPFELTDEALARIAAFDAAVPLPVTRQRKGRRATLDLGPLVHRIEAVSGRGLRLELISRSGSPGTKPAEVLAALLGLDADTALRLEVVKTGWVALGD